MKTFFYTLRLDENRSVCLVKEKELDYHEKCTVPATVVELLKNCFDIQHEAQECVYLICQRSDLSVSGIFLVSKGTIDMAHVSVREIMSRVLLVNATNFIVVHNHPSGCVNPSKEDMKAANDIYQAARLLDTTMNDFIIIGDDFISFHSNGIAPFRR